MDNPSELKGGILLLIKYKVLKDEKLV